MAYQNVFCAGLAAYAFGCKPATPEVSDKPVKRADGPYTVTQEADDVRVVNASRGEEFRGASVTQLAWTGTEAMMVYTSPGSLMEHLWIGRMDKDGKVLDRRPVQLEREVSGRLYPQWADGAVVSVYGTGLTHHWIAVVPDGRVQEIKQLEQRAGQHFLGSWGAVHKSGRFAIASFLGDFVADEPKRNQIELYDRDGVLGASVPVSCEFVGDIAATDWGYVAQCEGKFDPGHRDALTTRILGIRDGIIAWESEGLPAGRGLSLGSDGNRTLAIYVTDSSSGSTYPVTTLVIDGEGHTIGTPRTSVSRAPEPLAPVIWTGREFASFDRNLLMRYASDGRPLGVWEVEPRCNRDFEIGDVAWTGSAYLVVGSWGWDGCYLMTNEVITDGEREYPLPRGLQWDLASDSLEPPSD